MADEPTAAVTDPEPVIESEKPKKKSIIVWQCLNPECTNTNKRILRTASSFALSFYGVDSSSGKKRKICPRCHDIVDSHRRRLLQKLEDGESLLSEPLPVPRDLVLLEDSDENSETDSSEESEYEMDTGELVSREDTGSSSGSSMSGDFEQQLDKIMGSAIEKMNFDKMLTTATKDLKNRLDSFKDDFDATDKIYEKLEEEVDNLRKELYKDFEPRIEELPPVDLNKVSATRPILPSGASGHQLTPSSGLAMTSHALPPAGGVLSRPALVTGQQVIAMRHGNLQTWKPGVVEEVQDPGEVDERLYRIRFEAVQGNKNVVQKKLLKIKNVAYSSVSRVRLPVGTRCIGLFREAEDQAGAFYSGVVAEPPKQTNRNRYLVFFDDGYASYIRHEELRLVCYQSPDVWDDVHIDSREFIKKYLDKYPERPMVKLSPGQMVKTESDGRWCQTRVVTVDASLVRLKFLADSRVEWIYRGSTRLGPLFTEMEQQKLRRLQNDEAEKAGAGHAHRRQTAPVRRRNAPYIEYRRDAQEAQEPGQGAAQEEGGASDKEDKEQVKRPVARKSTTAVRKQEQSATTKWEYEGQTFKTEIDPPPRIKFRQHNCSTNCLADPRYQYKEKNFFRCVDTKSPNNDKDLKNFNPLLIPVMLGWLRQVTKHKFNGKVKKKVTYQSPCGRRFRSLTEVHRYLTITESKLEIDFFNFDWWLHVYHEFKSGREFCTIKDLSYGKENVAISCVNAIDRSFPEYVEYSTTRLPQKDVHLNTDTEFMTSCDCTDDCRRKDRCACWQLTIQNTRCDRENKIHKDVGYQFRRLNEIVVTGIYECNRNCKCSKTCLNRVVQHPLRVKLQVFKTEKRGWGIRTLHDIPQGAFISVYVGNLYSSEEANKQGQNFGDEYFAELDMIEVIERRKDGYESDVSDEGFNDDEDNNAEPTPDAGKHSSKFSEAKYTSEEYSTEEETNDDRDFNPGLLQFDGGNDDDTDDEASGGHKQRRGGFSATVGIAGPKTSKAAAKPQTERFVSARRMFGKNEDVYIMDAKSIGNIGRYLNHSCNPNIFVQNVFVDTHDLRFPWIAFFTSHFVRAGGELCWDYNYEVGSIPGKELYCSCGSEYCRGKLL